MKYINDTVRRQDRLMDEERAREILKTAEYGVLSMTDGDQPYGIPVNFIWDGKDSIYIHCAPEGRKLRIIEKTQRSRCVLSGMFISCRVTSRLSMRVSSFSEKPTSICRKKSA